MRTLTPAKADALLGIIPTTPIPKEVTFLKSEAETRIWQPLGRAGAAMAEVHAALGEALEQREAIDADPDYVRLPDPAAVEQIRRELDQIVTGSVA